MMSLSALLTVHDELDLFLVQLPLKWEIVRGNYIVYFEKEKIWSFKDDSLNERLL